MENFATPNNLKATPFQNVIPLTSLPGSWMCTQTQDFVADDASPVNVSIQELAHALSHINSFTGHTLRPWSIAQHALLTLRLSESEELGPKHLSQKESAELGYCVLMQDIHKAFSSDLIGMRTTDVKHVWRDIEDSIEQRVRSQYGLDRLMPNYAELVKHYDLLALRIERTVLLGPQGNRLPWPVLDAVDEKHASRDWIHATGKEVAVFEQLDREILGFAPMAKEVFLECFHRLQKELQYG